MNTTRRSRATTTKRIAERLLLGTVMALIAAVLDRRLRRVFARQQRSKPFSPPAPGR